MTDMLQAGSAWLAGQLRAHASQTITYRRGRQSVAISAVPASARYEIERAGGVVEEWQGIDWHVSAAALLLRGETVEPRRGDRIVDAAGAVYEVVGPGEAPAWEYSDEPYRRELKIHTKRVRE